MSSILRGFVLYVVLLAAAFLIAELFKWDLAPVVAVMALAGTCVNFFKESE